MKAVYDLEHWQPSYTTAVFLLIAEQQRILRGEEHIDIEIMQGTQEGGFGYYHRWPKLLSDKQKMYDNVLSPMLYMLPSVRSVKFQVPRYELEPDTFILPTKYQTEGYIKAYSSGLRPFHQPMNCWRDSKLITVTLRECGIHHWPQRDSDMARWTGAARILQGKGYKVVVVRDSQFYDHPVKKLVIDPEAALYLECRARLYQRAALNLFVSNGPAWFSLALDVPLLMFRPTCETANKGSTDEAMAAAGVIRGQQIVGAPLHQRLVWEDDLPDTIVNRALEFLSRVAKG